MRSNGVVYWLHGDHLGSTSLTTDASGEVVAEQKYLPYGEVRWVTGTQATDFSFTGQRGEDFGLIDYHARYYSPSQLVSIEMSGQKAEGDSQRAVSFRSRSGYRSYVGWVEVRNPTFPQNTILLSRATQSMMPPSSIVRLS